METNQKIRITSAIIFTLTAVLYILFYTYMGLHENVTVFSSRHSPYYGTIINLTPEVVEDDTAPMGKRVVYSWLMDAHCENGDYLCFFISDHHVDVTIDGEKIYSLSSDSEHGTAKGVSSNWCIVPLSPEDAGKRITIVLTPLVTDYLGLDLDLEIMVGSNYNIILRVLRRDLFPMLLSTLCVALGIIIVVIQCSLQLFSGTSQWDILFTGVFSIVLGIWRITDIRSAPLIFPGNPKVLGYISVGMMFFAGPALLQVVSAHFQPQQARRTHIMSMAISGLGLVILGMQVFGAMDMENFRILIHCMLGGGIVMATIYSIYGRKINPAARERIAWRYLPLVAIGIGLDLLTFYILRNSADLIYTCLFFLIFMSIAFISSFRETSKMVYRDPRTGLFNKARWNELMQADSGTEGFIGILVFDMNGLKKVNDTLGHEAGDRMIFAFADILRNALPSSSVICRWGGDEFAVFLPKVNSRKMALYSESVYRVAEEYNQNNPEVKIYFAMGQAMAEEHPEMSRLELFHLADEMMYQNKQRWYAEKHKRESLQG